MYNQLQLKRISDFIWGKLAFVVTPSEYREFIQFCQANGALIQPAEEYLNDEPGPISAGHACSFYRFGSRRSLTYCCPADGDRTPDIEHVAFALMHDSRGIKPTKVAQVEGKWDGAKDWGVSKIEARRQLKDLERQIIITRNLLVAMEETKDNIKALIGAD